MNREAAIISISVGALALWGLLRPRGLGGEASQAAIRALYQPVSFLPNAVPPPSGPFTVTATYRLRYGDEIQPMRVGGDLERVRYVVNQLAHCNLQTMRGDLVAIDCWRIVVRRGPHILSRYERAPRVAPGRRWVRRGRDLGTLQHPSLLCEAPFCTMNPQLVSEGARSCLEA